MSAEARVADFIGRLLDDTLDSIQSSHIDQTVRLAAAAEAAALPVEEIAALIDENDVAAAQERPEFKGADKEEVRFALAARESALRLAAVEQGLPRLVIDTGEIAAKTTFRIEAETDADGRAPGRDERPAPRRPTAPSPPVRAETLKSLLLSRRPQTRDEALNISIRPVTEANAGREKTENLAEFTLNLKFRVIY